MATEMRDRLLAIVAEPLAVAQAAGHVRGDLELADTPLIIGMLSQAAGFIDVSGSSPDRIRARGIKLLLQAIGPVSARTPLRDGARP